MSSLHILDISPLSDVGLVKMFYQSIGCLFVLQTVFFALQKLCNFMRSHLSKKISPVPMCSRLFPAFFSISFSVSGFMWRYLIQLDLSFVQGDKNELICIFLYADKKLNQHYLLKIVPLPWMVLAPLLNIKWSYVYSFISGSSILFH